MTTAPLQVHFISVLPEIFTSFAALGIVGRAQRQGLLQLETHSPRQFAAGRYGSVDDLPYGGGSGMVLRPGVVLAAMQAAEQRPVAGGSLRLMLSPAAPSLTQQDVVQWSRLARLVLVCGRYEGIDARVEAHVDAVRSVGDVVLCGGEVAAMAVTEAVVRLRPGVLGNPASLDEESFGQSLLEYPQYTRPRVWEGQEVPAVLLSGDHAAIRRWRRQQSLRRTQRYRPDLLARAVLSDAERGMLQEAPDSSGERAMLQEAPGEAE
ncbi:MAG: tRNA (guanosine(37)-N1)-methyltransferase TrmD [Polyangiales bacterium]